MADDGATNRFGFEGPNFSFMNESPAGTEASANPSSLAEADASGAQQQPPPPPPQQQQQHLYPPSTSAPNWDFQTTPAYDNINIGASTAPTTQPGVSATTWPLPVFDQSQDAPFNFAGFSPSDVNSNVVFGAPNTEALNTTRQPGAAPMSPALQQKLRNIAMPPHLQYNSPKSASSPDSANNDSKGGIASSPEQGDGSKRDVRKRKASSDPEDEDDADDDDKPVKKTAHNMIEKRYRTNINDKIAALRDSVPSLRIMCKSARGEDTTEDREELHGLTPAHKLNKATVLSKATEYIRHLEKRNNRLLEENAAMQARIAAFEKLFMAGAMNGSMSPMQHPLTPMQYAQDNPQQFGSSPMGTPQPSNPASSGMIQVPDDMKRIISAQMAVGQPYPVPQQSFRGGNPPMMRQQQMQHQHQQAQQNGFFQGNPYFGKLMVGSLAGLMIIEAVRESEAGTETTEGRGLFALPLHFLRSLASSLDVRVMGYHALSSLKTLLLLGTFLWIFVPSLFASTDPQSKKPQAAMPRKAPSTASSIQIRRQAWLTSIQTVWVPQRSFILEAAALVLKAMKLSIRNAFGFHVFQMLTGITREQEVARVKAWSIALDSQLAGGDMDICKSRLALTLLASCTLPDTPIRSMMKALHIRLLLWQVTSSRLVQAGVNVIAAERARSKWKEARELNQLLVRLRRGAPGSLPHDDELPEHLVALVEQDCDDVLTPQVIQRAHNLAFSMDTTHNVTEPIDHMNSIVDDVAISSPLDAVAAWWSTQVLHQVLGDALDKGASPKAPDAVASSIDIAIRVSPIGSYAHMRAILARAVLVKQSRGAHIAAALQTLKSDRITGPFTKSNLIVGQRFDDFSADFSITLRCAMTIAHLTRVANTPKATLANVDFLNFFVRPENIACMTLLGFTSVMELMDHLLLHRDRDQSVEIEVILEKFAATLRLWIGGQFASQCGIHAELRQQIVERCLAVTKSLVGMEIDTGYGGMSDEETVRE
ncbi:dihydrodipicolinate synthase [Metarhizium album ARSEF 1941]|uniref:Dihydrodipicolinate synthase n=1 Tax=Metarhizium album (strain ARSEF 1941) TaxID=1081103 RepID=A0A0B2X8D0_METAS|nr:dihydrodipicolinate synthase [Metarhizium album ARSEF 1941]KHO01750.1 dihydrodipicolinate synthase [Metarhizium album ARSEF 1941]